MVNDKYLIYIVKVITDYDYISNVIDYDSISSENVNCDYLRLCNQLQSITDYPMPDIVS